MGVMVHDSFKRFSKRFAAPHTVTLHFSSDKANKLIKATLRNSRWFLRRSVTIPVFYRAHYKINTCAKLIRRLWSLAACSMEPDMLTKTFKEVAYKDFPYLLKDIRFWSMLAPGLRRINCEKWSRAINY